MRRPRHLVPLATAAALAAAAGGAALVGTGGVEAPAPSATVADATAPEALGVAGAVARTQRAARRHAATGRAEARRLDGLRRRERAIAWRRSRPLGTPSAGRLVDGVLLPREGLHFVTWDPVRWRRGSPPDRRHGTDHLLRTVLAVARAHRAAHPGAPRLTVGDISRPGGGDFSAPRPSPREFGPRPGGVGHASHQNGLDVDIYYPRRDRRERAPDGPGQIDRRLSQDLVDRFVAAGARHVFVGPRTGLAGPPGVVRVLPRHDGHLHVRLPPP
ncbi:MAG TPA: penicillin-insensitive murein endopeptidase [Miltoncostaeaceae bacterium]|nr:penicillin-insensitive murein endopeptidase [Miltoncostaeaceae bacterium]